MLLILELLDNLINIVVIEEVWPSFAFTSFIGTHASIGSSLPLLVVPLCNLLFLTLVDGKKAAFFIVANGVLVWHQYLVFVSALLFSSVILSQISLYLTKDSTNTVAISVTKAFSLIFKLLFTFLTIGLGRIVYKFYDLILNKLDSVQLMENVTLYRLWSAADLRYELDRLLEFVTLEFSEEEKFNLVQLSTNYSTLKANLVALISEKLADVEFTDEEILNQMSISDKVRSIYLDVLHFFATNPVLAAFSVVLSVVVVVGGCFYIYNTYRTFSNMVESVKKLNADVAELKQTTSAEVPTVVPTEVSAVVPETAVAVVAEANLPLLTGVPDATAQLSGIDVSEPRLAAIEERVKILERLRSEDLGQTDGMIRAHEEQFLKIYKALQNQIEFNKQAHLGSFRTVRQIDIMENRLKRLTDTLPQTKGNSTFIPDPVLLEERKAILNDTKVAANACIDFFKKMHE